MTLLDGPDVLQVWPEIDGTDADLNPVKLLSGVPTSVLGNMRPATADESAAAGQAISTLYRFTTRSFPAGAFGKVTWGGRDWDIVGEPMRRRGSAMTAHDTVLLKARGPEHL